MVQFCSAVLPRIAQTFGCHINRRAAGIAQADGPRNNGTYSVIKAGALAVPSAAAARLSRRPSWPPLPPRGCARPPRRTLWRNIVGFETALGIGCGVALPSIMAAAAAARLCSPATPDPVVQRAGV